MDSEKIPVDLHVNTMTGTEQEKTNSSLDERFYGNRKHSTLNGGLRRHLQEEVIIVILGTNRNFQRKYNWS